MTYQTMPTGVLPRGVRPRLGSISKSASILILLGLSFSLAAKTKVSLNMPCKASSVEGLLTPDKAVDGPKSQGSRWGSNYGTDKNKDSAWIFVDLGKKIVIDSVAIYWEHSGAKKYSLQVWKSEVDTPSYDDVGWTTIFTDTTLYYQPKPVDMCLSFIKLVPVEVRYLRVRCYKRLFEFGYSIMEYEVYAADGTATKIIGPRFDRNGKKPVGSEVMNSSLEKFTILGRAAEAGKSRVGMIVEVPLDANRTFR